MGCDDIGVGYGRRQHGQAAAAKGLTDNAPQRSAEVCKTKTTKKWPRRLVARRACRDHSVPCAGRDRPTLDSDAKRRHAAIRLVVSTMCVKRLGSVDPSAQGT